MTVLNIDATARSNKIKAANKVKAVDALELINREHLARMVKRDIGIVSAEPNSIEVKTRIEELEVAISNPSIDPAYQPPLPPGVPPPSVASITATITREPGWNNALGFRVVLAFSDDEFVPSNIAITVYQAPDCTDYHYTLGALQYDEVNNEYYGVCSPGFEPGDVDLYLALLYGSAPLTCFTVLAGTSSTEILVFGE